MPWQVQRHSGRNNGAWRTLYDGNEDRARRQFAAVALNLRQGGVLLVDPNGAMVDSTWAPRLRTR